MKEMIKRFFAFIGRFIESIITTLLLLSLLFACLGQYVAPSTMMFFSYFGLAFPPLISLSIIWTIVLLFRGSWKVLLLHSLTLLAIPMTLRTFPLNRSKNHDITTAAASDSTFKVLSYNIAKFVHKHKKTHAQIVDYICKVDADICFLQEYEASMERRYPELFRKLFDKYPYNSRKMKGDITWGVVIFSKHPIYGAGIASKGDIYNTAIFSDILIKEDTIRAVCCHLISNHLTREDKDAVRQIGKGSSIMDDLESTAYNLDSRFIKSYISREEMAADVARVVKDSPYKIVLTGDFNDVPISFTYNKIKADKLLCAKEEAGFGYNHSFNEFPFIVSIDHIMYSPEIECFAYFRDKIEYSDHYPTMAILKLPTTAH